MTTHWPKLQIFQCAGRASCMCDWRIRTPSGRVSPTWLAVGENMYWQEETYALGCVFRVAVKQQCQPVVKADSEGWQAHTRYTNILDALQQPMDTPCITYIPVGNGTHPKLWWQEKRTSKFFKFFIIMYCLQVTWSTQIICHVLCSRSIQYVGTIAFKRNHLTAK